MENLRSVQRKILSIPAALLLLSAHSHLCYLQQAYR